MEGIVMNVNGKTKLLALAYSVEDACLMKKWLGANGADFEIVSWVEELTLPIQAAVSEHLSVEGIDGFLIDDINHYDPIVCAQLDNILSSGNLEMYAAKSEGAAVLGKGVSVSSDQIYSINPIDSANSLNQVNPFNSANSLSTFNPAYSLSAFTPDHANVAYEEPMRIAV